MKTHNSNNVNQQKAMQHIKRAMKYAHKHEFADGNSRQSFGNGHDPQVKVWQSVAIGESLYERWLAIHNIFKYISDRKDEKLPKCCIDKRIGITTTCDDESIDKSDKHFLEQVFQKLGYTNDDAAVLADEMEGSLTLLGTPDEPVPWDLFEEEIPEIFFTILKDGTRYALQPFHETQLECRDKVAQFSYILKNADTLGIVAPPFDTAEQYKMMLEMNILPEIDGSKDLTELSEDARNILIDIILSQ